MIEHGDGYHLGYVQFSEEGRYAQPGQIDQVMANISTASDKGLILVAFTHGWKQTADSDSWSVRAFRDMLGAIAVREGQLAAYQSRAARQVAGIFLGWPGHVSTFPGLNGLTWFDRQAVAQRIASGDFGELLLQLKALREQHADSRLILAGHSLGAAMIYQRLADEPLRSPDSILSPLADLVLLLSPAVPASEVAKLAALSTADRAVLPPIMAITSEADSTLRMAFPLAQWLDRSPEDPEPDSPAGYRAMGTYGPMITHRLFMDGGRHALSPTAGSAHDLPVVQISASAEILRGHKDIANPRLVAFIAEVTALLNDDRLSRAALASAFPATQSVR